MSDITGLASWQDGALVPTMGALHAGHQALIRRAAELEGPVVVSVFVNPAQFAPGEDLERYPRTLDRDCELARAAGAAAIFAPPVGAIYPPGIDLSTPPLPGVATRPGLEDARRPGHLAGVVKVVARLFDLLRPRWAVFGEKDYQQLLVIESVVVQQRARHRWPGLRILRHETVRDPDGLAMSSRNVYLRADQREQALGLHRALQAACASGDIADAELAMRDVLVDHGLEIDYAVVRDARALLPMETLNRPARALIAARLGDVRLIDNAALGAA